MEEADLSFASLLLALRNSTDELDRKGIMKVKVNEMFYYQLRNHDRSFR